MSRARDADKKKDLLSRKFSVPQKMSNEERALLSSETEKEKQLKLKLELFESILDTTMEDLQMAENNLESLKLDKKSYSIG